MGKASRSKKAARAIRPPRDIATTVARIDDHLAVLDEDVPGWCAVLDQHGSNRGIGLPDWPEWCLLPMAGPYAVCEAAGLVDLQRGELAGAAAGMAALGVPHGAHFNRLVDLLISSLAGGVGVWAWRRARLDPLQTSLLLVVGITLRLQPPDADTVEEMVKLYTAGQSLAAVSRALGVNTRTVQRYLGQRRVPIRDTHGRARPTR